MSAVLEPGSGGRNVIGGALALDLHQDDHAFEIFAVPLLERFEQLKSQRFGIDIDLDAGSVARGLVRVFTGVEAARGQFIGERIAQQEFFTVST